MEFFKHFRTLIIPDLYETVLFIGMEEDTDRNLIDEELVLAFPEVQKR